METLYSGFGVLKNQYMVFLLLTKYISFATISLQRFLEDAGKGEFSGGMQVLCDVYKRAFRSEALA